MRGDGPSVYEALDACKLAERIPIMTADYQLVP